jgi:TP901 family phage tail tape measure protein
MAEDQLGNAFVAIRATTEFLIKDLADAESMTSKVVTKIGETAGNMGQALSVGLTAPILAIGGAAIAASLVVDDALDSIRVSTGATGDTLAGLEGNFKNVFASVPVSAEDAATAISALNGALGLTGDPLEKLATQSLNLARITGGDLNTQIAASAKLFQGWKVATEEQGTTLDFLFKVSQATGVSVETLAGQAATLGPAFRELGIGLEESLTLLGSWEHAGLNVETMMAGLKKAVASFAKEGVKDTSAALATLVDDIKNAGTQGEANALAMDTFGDKAGPELAAAIREGKLEVSDLIDTLKKSEETINGVAGETDGFTEKMTELRNKLTLVLEPLGTALVDAMVDVLDAAKPLLDQLVDLAEWFSKLPTPVKGTALALAGIAAAAGPVLIVVGQMISAFTGVMQAAPAMSLAIGGVSKATLALLPLMGQIVLVVASVTAVVTAGTQAWGLYRDRQEQAKLATAQNFSHTQAMAAASKIAGHEITNLAEALKVLQADAARQRAEQDALTAATAKGTEATRTAASVSTKFGEALKAAQAEVRGLSAAKKEQIQAALALGTSQADIAKELKVSEAAVGLYKEALDKSADATRKHDEATKKFKESVKGFTFAGVGFAAPIQDAEHAAQGLGASLHNLASGTWEESVEAAKKNAAATEEWVAKFGMLPGAAIGFKGTLNETLAATQGFDFSKLGGKLASSLVAAVQGGGNVGKALGGTLGQELGSNMGEKASAWAGKAISGTLGKTIGGALGSVVPVIGTLFGSLAGGAIGKGISKLFGGGEGKKVNDMRDKFVSAAGGIDVLNAKAQAAGMTLDKLLGAKKVSDFEAAVTQLNGAFETQAADLELAKTAAEEFGIPFERMGQAFKQTEMDTSAAGLLEKIKALTASGVDLGTVIEFAGDDVGTFIQRAIEAGTTVPIEMKAIAKQMIETGTLVDGAGEAFTDMSQIPFAEGPNEKLASIATALEKIVGVLTGAFPAAAETAATKVAGALAGIRPQPIDVPIRFNVEGEIPGGGEASIPGMAEGGVVLGPTFLQAGESGAEAIVPLDRLDAMLRVSQESGNQQLTERFDRLASTLDNLMNSLPELMALSMRDALRGAV